MVSHMQGGEKVKVDEAIIRGLKALEAGANRVDLDAEIFSVTIYKIKDMIRIDLKPTREEKKS